MFHGDHPDLRRALDRARAMAAGLGHPRVGSEHLLLALGAAGDTVSTVLDRHGASEAAIREAARQAAPLGAGAAADRDSLAPFGIDLDTLLSGQSPTVLDRPTSRESLRPFGAARGRRRCARMSPPYGLDAQAAYEASLRLALARQDRHHRPEHLALCLVVLDPGAAWTLSAAGVDVPSLLVDLAGTYPPPTRNLLLRARRRIGHRTRGHDLVRRYQRTTGRRPAISSTAVAALIIG